MDLQRYLCETIKKKNITKFAWFKFFGKYIKFVKKVNQMKYIDMFTFVKTSDLIVFHV